eukprot:2726204-Rhodomonas_salina.5
MAEAESIVIHATITMRPRSAVAATKCRQPRQAWTNTAIIASLDCCVAFARPGLPDGRDKEVKERVAKGV